MFPSTLCLTKIDDLSSDPYGDRSRWEGGTVGRMELPLVTDTLFSGPENPTLEVSFCTTRPSGDPGLLESVEGFVVGVSHALTLSPYESETRLVGI